ncbi:hypothetical protein [Vallitalea guaymasensis]|uniref:hypothetical protein n=1 Tax=Vallitalea guaymasensis TaxID=1185412 RepID=UPI000DE21A44|nr:hypothetical protein [Vallitalea guaymasensis]
MIQNTIIMMITESKWKELNNYLKRGVLIKAIAKEEIKSNVTLSDFSIRRASKECEIIKPITRDDIDCQKEILNNKSLQAIIKKRDELLEMVCLHDSKELRSRIIYLSEKQRKIQDEICIKYSIL